MATADAFTFSRDFPIDRARMYALWTDVASLQRWFSPAGVTNVKSALDLRPGGRYHAGLRTPDGHEMWGLWVFTAVEPGRKLQWHHSFSDAAGGLTRHPLSADWPLTLLSTVTFEDADGAPGTTRVALRWEPHEASDVERARFDASHESMRGGWTGTFDQLAQYVATLG